MQIFSFALQLLLLSSASMTSPASVSSLPGTSLKAASDDTRFNSMPLVDSGAIYNFPATTSAAPPVPLGTSFRSLTNAVRKEICLAAAITRANSFATLIFGTIVVASFAVAQSPALSAWLWTTLKSIPWFFLYGYHFDCENQIYGYEEDKFNKDDIPLKSKRPLVNGLITMKGIQFRSAVSGICWLAVSHWLCGIKLALYAFSWGALSCFYHYLGFSENFVGKNYVFMSGGAIIMLFAARLMAGETQASTFVPVIVGLLLGLACDIQDFRDEAGDRAVGRKTTAVLLGVKLARRIWGVQFAALTAGFAYLIRHALAWPDMILGIGAAALAIRVQANKSIKEDDKSYGWYLTIMLGFFCRSAFWTALFLIWSQHFIERGFL